MTKYYRNKLAMQEDWKLHIPDLPPHISCHPQPSTPPHTYAFHSPDAPPHSSICHLRALEKMIHRFYSTWNANKLKSKNKRAHYCLQSNILTILCELPLKYPSPGTIWFQTQMSHHKTARLLSSPSLSSFPICRLQARPWKCSGLISDHLRSIIWNTAPKPQALTSRNCMRERTNVQVTEGNAGDCKPDDHKHSGDQQ